MSKYDAPFALPPQARSIQHSSIAPSIRHCPQGPKPWPAPGLCCSIAQRNARCCGGLVPFWASQRASLAVRIALAR